jgi:FAD/FMN-containing dehydrogenase
VRRAPRRPRAPRSGSHDYEGLSYRSLTPARPFVIIDLAALRVVRVDTARRTAWVGYGATLGELYFAIAKSSARLGFPGGLGPTVGVGGQRCGSTASPRTTSSTPSLSTPQAGSWTGPPWG